MYSVTSERPYKAAIVKRDQGCQIFLGEIHQNEGKITIVLPQNIPNDHKNIPNYHKFYQHFQFQDPPKYSRIILFGMKINHLATLSAIKTDPSYQQII
jgi:hypothetical protein